MCDPPRRDRSANPSVRWRCRRRSSWGVRDALGLAGARPARHNTLVGDEVPDAGQLGLIQQARLDRHARAREGPAQLGCRHRQRVGSETLLVRIELDGAEAARVAHRQPAAVAEPHGEPVVATVVGPAVQEPLHAGLTVDDEAPAHAEVDPEHGADRAAHAPPHVEEHQLSPPAGRHEPRLRQRRRYVVGVQAALQVPRVGRVDGLYHPVQGESRRQRPVPLHFRELGHYTRWARSKIESSIGSVSLPVNVFCWLGW